MTLKVGDLVKLKTSGTSDPYGAVDKVRLKKGEQFADVLWKDGEKYRLSKMIPAKKLRGWTFLEKQTFTVSTDKAFEKKVLTNQME